MLGGNLDDKLQIIPQGTPVMDSIVDDSNESSSDEKNGSQDESSD